MHPSNRPSSWSFRLFFETLKNRRRLWLSPTVAFFIVSVVYASMKPEVWKATQSLMLRDEAIGNLERLGRFSNSEALKTAQETIVQISKNHTVVAESLKQIGPPTQYATPSDWPTPNDIEDAQGDIAVIAPKGASFGSTEVFRLEVKAESSQRAVALANAVCDRMETYLKQVRNLKAESVISELQKKLALSKSELETSTRQLEIMEKEAGSDLGELRTLSESNAGESNLRTAQSQLKNELRQAKAAQAANKEKKAILTAALNDPQQIVASPNQLLETQPSLKKLKEGLVDAQIRSANLAGSRSKDHPLLQAALSAEEEIRIQLHEELNNALRTLSADSTITDNLVVSLEKQLAETQARMDLLASIRARYSNLVNEVRSRNEIMEKTQAALTEILSAQSATQSASLVTRLDPPEAGNKPLGPSKSIIVLGGTLGGFLVGMGLVFLTLPLSPQQGRRWNDFLPFGRRSTDQPNGTGPERRSVPNTVPTSSTNVEVTSFGRREGDQVQEQPPVLVGLENPSEATSSNATPSEIKRPLPGDRRRGGDRRRNPS